MLKNFLSDVLFLVVGKQAEGISELLHSKKHVNEFLIAKKLGITINQTRNILYKISDKGLVSSIRKKDKRKGWYTYFWKIEVLKTLEFLKDHLLKRMEQISYQIKSRESKHFYACEKCKLEFNEENALLRDFTCRECGNVFVIKDNTKLIRDLKKELTKLENELKVINQEIEKEKEKGSKVRENEIRKSIKQKEKLKKNKKDKVKVENKIKKGKEINKSKGKMKKFKNKSKKAEPKKFKAKKISNKDKKNKKQKKRR